MFHWIHHIFNPHCQECMLENENNRNLKNTCYSCETLREQLSLEREEKLLLLKKLLPDVKEEKIEKKENLQSIRTSPIGWAEKRNLLETEDRAKAESLRRKNEELEKDLLLVEKVNG